MVYQFQIHSFFKDEINIHFSYLTFANQYGSLTCVKYKKNLTLSSAEITKNNESLFQFQYIP